MTLPFYLQADSHWYKHGCSVVLCVVGEIQQTTTAAASTSEMVEETTSTISTTTSGTVYNDWKMVFKF